MQIFTILLITSILISGCIDQHIITIPKSFTNFSIPIDNIPNPLMAEKPWIQCDQSEDLGHICYKNNQFPPLKNISEVEFNGLRNAEIWFITRNTHSMYPTMKWPNAYIAISKNINEIDTGDIIIFESNKGPNLFIGHTVHRVINRYDIGNIRYFKTQGDFNEYIDIPDTPSNRVKGVIIGRYNNLTKLDNPF